MFVVVQYKGDWPARVDERIIEEPERWVQSACVLCRFVALNRWTLITDLRKSNGCGMDVGVKGEGKDARIVGVRGRAVDRYAMLRSKNISADVKITESTVEESDPKACTHGQPIDIPTASYTL